MTSSAPLRSEEPEAGSRALAYLLLALTSVFWGGNAVAGRMAVGEVSPMTLTCVRWAFIAMFFALWLKEPIRQSMPVLRASWLRVTLMGALGFTTFNGLFYYSAHYTTAMNILILQGTIPVLVVLGALFLNRTKFTPFQAIGMAITFFGVALVATRGRIDALFSLQFNVGDMLMLGACLIQAGYVLSLSRRPKLDAMVLFFAMAMAAFVTSLPLMVSEILAEVTIWPSPTGWAILFYVTVFPSTLAQIFFIRGVAIVGPGRAGLFINLVPVFGALLAVAILGEVANSYHLVALACVVGGILLAETRTNSTFRAGAKP